MRLHYSNEEKSDAKHKVRVSELFTKIIKSSSRWHRIIRLKAKYKKHEQRLIHYPRYTANI